MTEITGEFHVSDEATLREVIQAAGDLRGGGRPTPQAVSFAVIGISRHRADTHVGRDALEPVRPTDEFIHAEVGRAGDDGASLSVRRPTPTGRNVPWNSDVVC